MRYTLIFIFSEDMKRVLMQLKNKGPYPGRYNGVGGKIDPFDVDEVTGALREILEETGLTEEDIHPLEFLQKTTSRVGNKMFVYYTRIKSGSEFKQIEDEPLQWFNASELLSITDKRLAGEGEVQYYINFATILEQSAH